MKAIVEFLFDDPQYKEFRKYDKGVLDGYVRGGNDTPYAAVINLRTKRLTLPSTTSFQVLYYTNDIKKINHLLGLEQ